MKFQFLSLASAAFFASSTDFAAPVSSGPVFGAWQTATIKPSGDVTTGNAASLFPLTH